MITDINSEDRLVQKTFAEHLHDQLGWDSVYAWNEETFGPSGRLGRASEREVVLLRDLRKAIAGLNPTLPEQAWAQAIEKLTRVDFSRSLLQHNREFYGFIRNGVPVEWREDGGEARHARVRVVDFRDSTNNRFLAVREMKIQGLRVPHYNRRADLVCFVNGLPLVFIELKAVYRNIRAGFDDNLTDYLNEHSIAQAFYHSAFLVVSNGDRARYGSITSKWEHFTEWKRNSEKEKGRVEAEVLLNGMLAKERLLDLVENFIVFDDSKPGGTRKIVARNHQVLGVNNAVASVIRQEQLKKTFPPGERLVPYEAAEWQMPLAAEDNPSDSGHHEILPDPLRKGERTGFLVKRTEKEIFAEGNGSDSAGKIRTREREKLEALPLVKRAHPDLGRLGVFWHTQGSGKSYSMVFLTEKVRRVVPGSFTFVVMTDREDLDDQIFRTFVGCGVADEKAPRAKSGEDLKSLLAQNHRFVFSLIHKFNQDVTEPYSDRDDIIVISDEAHRTQAGKFARNMRLALPYASFIGFTGTPLFRHDHLTRRIFGGYVSRYDFKRSEEDQSTVKLIYENRGEKLGIARLDLNDRIAAKIEEAKLAKVKALIPQVEAECTAAADPDQKARQSQRLEWLRGQAQWMESTIIEIIISEAQNEIRDFQRWDFDIIPHRVVMKNGFQTADGKRVAVQDAFKDPEHLFRIAIVCAMWLTGFDVESLSTLYIDKPMKAHTLMQAIARANRIYPGKDCGVIVDYNGMLKSLQEALAQYALGDEEGGGDGRDIVAPIEDLVKALIQAIEAAEKHLTGLGFDPARLVGAKGFQRIEALRDAADVLYGGDEAKRRFEIMARQVFIRFKALLMEPSAFVFAERHDNIEAIYKKLQEKRDTADVTDVLKELHKIVNEAIRTQEPGKDRADGLTVDLSRIDFAKLRDEFAKRVKHKHAALQDIREVVEKKLQQMLSNNPMRMDYYKKYQEIIADYNREKDRVTVEETFAKLVDLANSLDKEQRRAAEEGLSEDELALFDLIFDERISKSDREKLKQASKALLASLRELLKPMPRWAQSVQTQAEVKVFVLDNLWQSLPRPPFMEDDAESLAERVYDYVWQRSMSGMPLEAHMAS